MFNGYSIIVDIIAAISWLPSLILQIFPEPHTVLVAWLFNWYAQIIFTLLLLNALQIRNYVTAAGSTKGHLTCVYLSIDNLSCE